MEEELRKLGFTNNEIKVYVLLCKYESLSGNEVARKVALNRSVAYTTLNSLVKKAMVSVIKKNSRKAFSVSNPEILLNPIKEKESLARRVIERVNNTRKISSKEDSVEVYEGVQATKKIYNLFMSHENEIIYTTGGSGKMFARHKIHFEHYKKIVERRNIIIRTLISNDYPKKEYWQTMKNWHAKYIDVPVNNASVSIVRDHVVFHSYEDEPYVIVISNPAIANLMRAYFSRFWEIV